MGDIVELKRQVNTVDCIGFIVGVIIGSGIFISPKGVLLYSGSIGWALVVWACCGAFSTIGALCYAELGSSIPKSGGDYTYIKDSWGRLFAFLQTWNNLLAIRTASSAVLSITAATYILSPFYHSCDNGGVPYGASRTLACAILIFVTFVNCYSVPLARKMQVIFTVAKISSLAIIVVSGMYLLVKGNSFNFHQAFDLDAASWGTFPLAFYSGMYAFSGWNFVTNVTEEVLKPSRTIPLSIIISMVFVTLLYFGTNVAYFVVLTPEEILKADAVAVSYGYKVLGKWWILIPVSVAFSCIGSINGGLFTFSRQYYVAGRDGQLPDVLSMIHVEHKTPLPAAAILLPIASLMLINESIFSLLNFLSFTAWLFIAMTTTSLCYFRWKFPNMERPFKVPLALPIIFIVLSLLMVGGSIYAAPKDVGIGSAITLSGVPVWIGLVWWQNKPRWMRKFSDHFTVTMQQLLCVVPPDDKDQ